MLKDEIKAAAFWAKHFNRFLFWLLIGHFSFFLLVGCSTQSKMQRYREASAHYKLGISYLTDQSLQQAYVEFQKAVELNPKDRDSHYALGHIHFVQRNYDAAEKSFKQALKIDSDYSEAYNYLGQVYEQKGDTDTAIRQYKRALQNSTYSTPDKAHFNLGNIYQKKNQTDDAAKEWQRAVLINPDHLLAHYALAKHYADEGRLQESIFSYQNVLRLFPDSPQARYQFAWVYLKANQRTEALKQFKEITERFPNTEQASRSKKHLAFFESHFERLRPGMTVEQVDRLLGKKEQVDRRSGPAAGEEQWYLNHYDLVLRFEGGRYTGYQENSKN
jgi:type IV pilus assembly protein PilF